MFHFQSFILVVLSSMAAESLSAQANTLPSLPATAGPASIEVSRRAVRAWMQDWIDDSALIRGERLRTCAVAKLEGVGFFFPAPMTETRAHLQNVFRKGRRLASGVHQPFLIPLTTPLNDIAQAIALTESEKAEANGLQARLARLDASQTSEIPSFLTDKLRVFIDTTGWISLVSKRLYDEEIARHLEQRGFLENAFKHAAFCQAYRTREMRNAELVRLGQVLLNAHLMLAAQD